jgi:hypothetical protein
MVDYDWFITLDSAETPCFDILSGKSRITVSLLDYAMTHNSKYPLAWSLLRLALLIAWFCIVVSFATVVCIGLAYMMREYIQRELLRTAAVYVCGVVWIALVVYLGFLLPSRIRKIQIRNSR